MTANTATANGRAILTPVLARGLPEGSSGFAGSPGAAGGVSLGEEGSPGVAGSLGSGESLVSGDGDSLGAGVGDSLGSGVSPGVGGLAGSR